MIKIDLSQKHPTVRNLLIETLEREATALAEVFSERPLESLAEAHYLLFLVELASQLKEPAQPQALPVLKPLEVA